MVDTDLHDPTTRRRAALLFRPDAALSHTDALVVWGLLADPPKPTRIHLTTDRSSSTTPNPAIRLHRRSAFSLDACRVRNGMRVVCLERAIIDSWPLLPRADRRGPAIIAVRERRTLAQRLLRELDRGYRPSGATEMRRLFELLALGVHSELEAWGHEHVFLDARLPPSRAQVPVRLMTGRVVYLDRLFEAEKVVVELDGDAYHSSREQRDRDSRRDAELAALGYLTIRISHRRLVSAPDAFVNELMNVLTARRRQLAISA